MWPFRPKDTDPLALAVADAERRLAWGTEQGIGVPADLMTPILAARDAVAAGSADRTVREAFYRAHAALSKITAAPCRNGDAAGPFEKAVDDAEHLLRYAAEMAIEVPPPLSSGVLAARAALDADGVTDRTRSEFYAAYTGLPARFGEATAASIRNCSSRRTKWALARTRFFAVGITLFIAAISIVTFVTDDIAKKIVEDTGSANVLAATLRAGLTTGAGDTVGKGYAADDPCHFTDKPPEDQNARKVRDVQDVTQLQEFASTIRSLHSRAVKLNWFIGRGECDPYGFCGDPVAPPRPDAAQAGRELQLNPTIINYPAEVFCKIRTLQQVRTFASNVHSSYAAAFGANAAYALPIYYALLGAYAFRLRVFGDAIKRRTYQPSPADSARMITAVIAGAIVSLFYPAQGASLSPLAVAFLVGYGVEIFFKFLDGMIDSLGSGSLAQRPRAAGGA